MRVLFISDVYFPRVNGVSTSIRTFRADLHDAGVDTVLVAPDYGASAGGTGARPAAGQDEPGVLRVTAGKVPRDPEDRRMKFLALRHRLDQLEGQPFDLVHIHTPFLAHYAGVRFAARKGIPVIATYHTFFEEYLHHYVPMLPRALGRALARRFTRSQCAQLAAIVAPSEPMRALLLAYGVSTRIQVIPTGLPAERYVPGDGARFRAKFGIAAERPLLLYVGRVAHEKNIEFLLHAFVALRRTRPGTLLAIAGEGPARDHLQSLATQLGIAPDVQFIGYLDRERGLADCYAAADVFVFASRTETQGLVLLEALAQGRPVVSTAHLGTASILQAGCGARVAPEKPDAFAQAIADILDHPARAARLSAQARSYAQRWASSHMAWRLGELYRELVYQHEPAGVVAA
ncbi:MAG TPA: glycosyltransferase [Steroidobacteraceae bacterium]|nr:glycosyltransferase [Steroidobacteraceae bacterium]